jgi:A-macroglobulin TED domain
LIKLKIDAVGKKLLDSIEKYLKVIPEGFPRSVTKSVLVARNNVFSSGPKSLQCDLPSNAANGTSSLVASITGNLLGLKIDELQSLIRHFDYSLETTLKPFTQSVLSLRYLEFAGQLTETFKLKAVSTIKTSYTVLLRYRRLDGSFGGSTWVTALVAETLELAEPYIDYDSNIVTGCFTFIQSKQNLDGSFKESGIVSDSVAKQLFVRGVSMHAYISKVLSRSLNKFPQFTSVRNKALDYVVKNANKSDVYDVVISTLALHSGNHTSFSDFYQKMISIGIENNDQLKWESLIFIPTRDVSFDLTAFALQLLKDTNFEKAAKAASYLIQNIDFETSYDSYQYQDLAKGILALLDYDSSLKASLSGLSIRLNSNMGNNIDAQITSSNSMTIQNFVLNPLSSKLNVSSFNGFGVAVVGLTCKYYEIWVRTLGIPTFNIQTSLVRQCATPLQLQICIDYNALSNDDYKSNLAVMKLTLPSGFVYDESQIVPPIIRVCITNF